LPPRTLAGRRRDQLTKAPDYGAVLVAITVAQFYLSGMLQRTLPAGFIAPCLPTKTTQLPSGGQWLHEIKHDDFRIIARKSSGRVTLYSRPGNDLSRRFPLIVETLARLRSRSCIIDGEAVACDDNGIASFDLVRHHRANDSVFLYAFDLIELNGDDLRSAIRLRSARPRLRARWPSLAPEIRFNEHIEGDGPTVFAHACKLGLEGIVSKRKDSAYRSGRSAREGKPTPSSPTIGRGSRRYTSW
jgi:bifunctional non-homologous end joining protein LigD